MGTEGGGRGDEGRGRREGGEGVGRGRERGGGGEDGVKEAEGRAEGGAEGRAGTLHPHDPPTWFMPSPLEPPHLVHAIPTRCPPTWFMPSPLGVPSPVVHEWPSHHSM